MFKPTCIYLGPSVTHRLYYTARAIVHTYFDVDYSYCGLEETIPDYSKIDVVISFLADKILKDKILDIPNINFHPAPPKYPGRGGASYALYNGDESYGATAHQMIEAVDAGPIYAVTEFPILKNATCETVFSTAEDSALILLTDFCCNYALSGKMPPIVHEFKWSGPAKTRKDFEEFLNMGEVAPFSSFDLVPMAKKIKATKHSKFPGPYIYVAGHKFELSKT